MAESPASDPPTMEELAVAEAKESRPAQPIQGAGPPPNGGIVAWLQVLGAFFIYFNTWGIINTYGEFQTFYQSDFLRSESPSNISWIGSFQAALLFIVGAATGPLYDAGYLRALLYVGSFLLVLGMMMTSICKTYWQTFLAQGLVIGLGNGCVFLASVAIVGQYFTTKKSFATGVASTGTSIGGVIYPIVFRRTQPTIGFGWTTRIIAFIMLATSIVPILTIKSRVAPPTRRDMLDLAAFRNIPYTLFNIGAFFSFMGIFILFFYIPLYALDVCSTDIDLAFYLLPIINTSAIFGRLIPNFIADKAGPLNIEIFLAWITAVLAFSWIAVQSTAGVVVLCVFYGFFSGPLISIAGPAVFSLTPNLSILGTRLGMTFTFIGLGVLIGTPVAGAILREGGWIGLQCWCGAVLATSGFFMLAARITKVGIGIARIA